MRNSIRKITYCGLSYGESRGVKKRVLYQTYAKLKQEPLPLSLMHIYALIYLPQLGAGYNWTDAQAAYGRGRTADSHSTRLQTQQ